MNIIDSPNSVEKDLVSIDTKSKKESKELSVPIEWHIPGNEQKLEVLQNMPINKFIVDSGEVSYRLKYTEEEKKLPTSAEKDHPIQSKALEDAFKGDVKEGSTTDFANQFYRVGKVLGKGAFGKVNLAIHKQSGELVAMKSMNKHYLIDNNSQLKIMQEVGILKRLDHTNVIGLKDSFETEKHIVFVLELCAGGDLLNYVRKRRKLNENLGKVIFKQILFALQH